MARQHGLAKWALIFALLVAVIILAKQFELFSVTGITTESKRVLYINEPINFQIQLLYGNLSVTSNGTVLNSTISDELITTNDITVKINNKNMSATVVELVPNQRYNISLTTNEEGYLSVIVKDKILMMELKAPVVNIEYDIPIQTTIGSKHTLFVKTLTPQGDLLNADKVLIEITDPHNQNEVVEMTKDSLGIFSYDMTYKYDHNYYFTITPSATSLNYKTQSRDATTVVQGTAEVPVFFYFMIANAVIFIAVIIIRNFKKIKELF